MPESFRRRFHRGQGYESGRNGIYYRRVQDESWINAITKVYGTFYIAFEIIPETEEIIEVDCSRTLELTKDFIRRLFIGKKFVTDAEQIEAEVKRRYYGSSTKAIIVAYRDALETF